MSHLSQNGKCGIWISLCVFEGDVHGLIWLDQNRVCTVSIAKALIVVQCLWCWTTWHHCREKRIFKFMNIPAVDMRWNGLIKDTDTRCTQRTWLNWRRNGLNYLPTVCRLFTTTRGTYLSLLLLKEVPSDVPSIPRLNFFLPPALSMFYHMGGLIKKSNFLLLALCC